MPDKWVANHRDYLPENTDIPLYGIRCIAVIDDNGKMGFSYHLDEPDAMDEYHLASVLTVLRDQVLADAAKNWTVTPYATRAGATDAADAAPDNGDGGDT